MTPVECARNVRAARPCTGAIPLAPSERPTLARFIAARSEGGAQPGAASTIDGRERIGQAPSSPIAGNF